MEIKSERIRYIDGLKGIACLFIMIGHYYGMVRFTQDGFFDSNVFSVLSHNPFKLLYDASFWLNLFFIMSGYLLAMSKVKSVFSLITKTIKRFFRFLLPIFCACVIIYLLYITVGFHNNATKQLFYNSHLQNFYRDKLTFLDIFIDPFRTVFLSNSHFNTAYWVISGMFFSSLIIYACDYFAEKFSKIRLPIAIAGLIAAWLLLKETGAACLTGMIIGWYADKICNFIKPKWFFIAITLFSVIMSVGFHELIYAKLVRFLPDSFSWLAFSSNWGIFYFSLLVISLKKFELIPKILSCKVFRFLGGLSFGIYSFHFPVFCSVGCLTFIKIVDNVGATSAFFIAFILSAAVTLLLSAAYHYTLENWCSKLIGTVSGKFDILLSNRKTITKQ